MPWAKHKGALLLQAYLKLLLPVTGSNAKSAQSSAEARVAARCMCGLLTALHHFNYAADLLQAVVPLMISKDAQLRQLSCDAVREVLMNDEEGKVAVEAVQLVGLLLCCCRATTHSIMPPCIPISIMRQTLNGIAVDMTHPASIMCLFSFTLCSLKLCLFCVHETSSAP